MRPEVTISADPDVYSPMNGGFMMLKPSRALYLEGLDVLRQCKFNTTHGWGLGGVAPESAPGFRGGPVPMSGFLRKRRPWDFGGAGTEQGFLFYMLWIRHRAGEYGARSRATLPLARHWWGAREKPWLRLGRIGAKGHVPAKETPEELAVLYDYAIHEAADGIRARSAAAAAIGATAAAAEATTAEDVAAEALPPLVAEQRRARRVIEASDQFDDVFLIWQSDMWKGDGYTLMATLPGTVSI